MYDCSVTYISCPEKTLEKNDTHLCVRVRTVCDHLIARLLYAGHRSFYVLKPIRVPSNNSLSLLLNELVTKSRILIGCSVLLVSKTEVLTCYLSTLRHIFIHLWNWFISSGDTHNAQSQQYLTWITTNAVIVKENREVAVLEVWETFWLYAGGSIPCWGLKTADCQ